MSQDIGHRQRRYLLSMGIRTACFVGAILAATAGAPVWLSLALVVGAVLLPYISVVMANGGREPQAQAHFGEPQGTARNEISGPRSETGS